MAYPPTVEAKVIALPAKLLKLCTPLLPVVALLPVHLNLEAAAKAEPKDLGGKMAQIVSTIVATGGDIVFKQNAVGDQEITFKSPLKRSRDEDDAESNQEGRNLKRRCQ